MTAPKKRIYEKKCSAIFKSLYYVLINVVISFSLASCSKSGLNLTPSEPKQKSYLQFEDIGSMFNADSLTDAKSSKIESVLAANPEFVSLSSKYEEAKLFIEDEIVKVDSTEKDIYAYIDSKLKEKYGNSFKFVNGYIEMNITLDQFSKFLNEDRVVAIDSNLYQFNENNIKMIRGLNYSLVKELDRFDSTNAVLGIYITPVEKTLTPIENGRIEASGDGWEGGNVSWSAMNDHGNNRMILYDELTNWAADNCRNSPNPSTCTYKRYYNYQLKGRLLKKKKVLWASYFVDDYAHVKFYGSTIVRVEGSNNLLITYDYTSAVDNDAVYKIYSGIGTLTVLNQRHTATAQDGRGTFCSIR